MINRKTGTVIALPFNLKQTLIGEGHPQDSEGRIIADQGFFFKTIENMKKVATRRAHNRTTRQARAQQRKRGFKTKS